MRLIAVTRVLNEEDIIEPFIRHHATFVDHHILLDNGSIDRTLEILAALSAEGLPLTVLQNRSIIFAEVQYNTILYHAAAAYGADWVLFLDADEFIDARRIGDLGDFLSAVPPKETSLAVELINYDAATNATRDELNIVRRLVCRLPAPIGVWKVFARGGLAPGRVCIDAGNHMMYIDGEYQASRRQGELRLAHYPTRSPLHWAGKAVMGWMKVLAAGEAERHNGSNNHYVASFEKLKTEPEALLWPALQPSEAVPERPDLVEDALDYGGGELRYTRSVDYRWRSLRLLLARAEQVTAAYGALLDSDPSLRQRVEAEAYRTDVLIRPDRAPMPPADEGSRSCP